ncbi:hypothetical protein [Nostoc sp. DSM 114161]|uniref:hypothetical protein n=1 Tax=Nostoc sp. DSM 114161 TaxID=3440143 RepID=UPI0040454FA0
MNFYEKYTLISIGDVNCHSSYIPHKFTASFASQTNLWRSGTQKQVFDRNIATETINIGLTQIVILNFQTNLKPAKNRGAQLRRARFLNLWLSEIRTERDL